MTPKITLFHIATVPRNRPNDEITSQIPKIRRERPEKAITGKNQESINRINLNFLHRTICRAAYPKGRVMRCRLNNSTKPRVVLHRETVIAE
jgi:hypothetical protein